MPKQRTSRLAPNSRMARVVLIIVPPVVKTKATLFVVNPSEPCSRAPIFVHVLPATLIHSSTARYTLYPAPDAQDSMCNIASRKICPMFENKLRIWPMNFQGHQ